MNLDYYTDKTSLKNVLNEITNIPELKDIHCFTGTGDENPHDNKQSIPTAFYTHTSFLYSFCKFLYQQNKEINILEIGMGVGSSSIFSYFSKKNNNFNIISIETNSSWFDNCLATYYTNTSVKCFKHQNFEEKYTNELINSKEYDLIFVDQGSWEDRNKSLLFYKPKAFIVHDYDFIFHHWPATHNHLSSNFKNVIWNDNYKTPLTDPPTGIFYNEPL